jgi:hypothetical protein
MEILVCDVEPIIFGYCMLLGFQVCGRIFVGLLDAWLQIVTFLADEASLSLIKGFLGRLSHV